MKSVLHNPERHTFDEVFLQERIDEQIGTVTSMVNVDLMVRGVYGRLGSYRQQHAENDIEDSLTRSPMKKHG